MINVVIWKLEFSLIIVGCGAGTPRLPSISVQPEYRGPACDSEVLQVIHITSVGMLQPPTFINIKHIIPASSSLPTEDTLMMLQKRGQERKSKVVYKKENLQSVSGSTCLNNQNTQRIDIEYSTSEWVRRGLSVSLAGLTVNDKCCPVFKQWHSLITHCQLSLHSAAPSAHNSLFCQDQARTSLSRQKN